MDLLTDVFAQAGLRRRMLDLHPLAAGVALRFPCERSLGLHVALRDGVFIHAGSAAGAVPLALQAGDIALMARGCSHLLSTHSDPAALTVTDLRPPEPDAPEPKVPEGRAGLAADTQGDGAALLSAAYQLWHPPVHPFLREMPGWIVLPAARVATLSGVQHTMTQLIEETRQPRLASQTIVHGLMDALFGYVLRELAWPDADAPGWRAATADPAVQQVLQLLHRNPAAPWTLAQLAAAVGVSRTALATRFRAIMGDTPLNYLRALRMTRAMQLLTQSDRNLERIALECGYQDAFSFSKVFKRVVGSSPREFRRRDAADRLLHWRLPATG
jgi:AraC-like DNA-binding protein